MISKEKTRRSVCASCCYLDFPKLPGNVIRKIFNSLDLPILMHGSQVSSTYNKDYYNWWEKDIIIEKPHLLFGK